MAKKIVKVKDRIEEKFREFQHGGFRWIQFEVEKEHDGYDELRDRSYNCYAKETVPKKGTKGGEKGE